jgi:hypothetical protein
MALAYLHRGWGFSPSGELTYVLELCLQDELESSHQHRRVSSRRQGWQSFEIRVNAFIGIALARLCK